MTTTMDLVAPVIVDGKIVALIEPVEGSLRVFRPRPPGARGPTSSIIACRGEYEDAGLRFVAYLPTGCDLPARAMGTFFRAARIVPPGSSLTRQLDAIWEHRDGLQLAGAWADGYIAEGAL